MKAPVASLLLTLGVLSTAQAIVLPVEEDTATTIPKSRVPSLTLKSGSATSLVVSGNPMAGTTTKAFIRFNAGGLPIPPGDVKQARLKLYFLSVSPKTPPVTDVEIRQSEDEWSETVASGEPDVIPGGLVANIPAAMIVKKTFVLVDVTAMVKGWLNGIADRGFVIGIAEGRFSIGSKEGSGSGYPAELEIDLVAGAGTVSEAQLAPAFSSALPRLASTNTFSGNNTFSGSVALQSGGLFMRESAANGGLFSGQFAVGDLPINQTYTFTTGGTVWTSGNDGTGSGLSADFLDGLSASDFAQRDVSNTFVGSSNTFQFFTSGSSLQIREDSGLTPGINVTGGGNPGILRLRNYLQIIASDDATRPGALDIRDTTGTPQIVLNSGNSTVGIGTPAPLAKLHVANGGIVPAASALQEDEVVIHAQDAVVGLYSQNQGTHSSALTFKELNADGTIVNTWGMVRKSSSTGGNLQFTYGTSSDHTANPVALSVSTVGNVTAAGNLITGGFNAVTRTTISPILNEETGVYYLAPVGGYSRVTTPANITLDSTTAILDGVVLGQTLILEGGGSQTVFIPDNANTRLPGSTVVLGMGDTLTLIWNGSDWVAISYLDN